ncbi:MAG: imidazole glycerol phosphate synthase subunit HisF [Bacteroidetes bacterium]|nr:imidazole glycerol phosphate synthase subunit HisF [Bacteroidota bacterium]
MFRPRIIPVLLLSNNGLVKSVRFKNHKYIGDPINAVKIFNDLKADELTFLDITAGKENRTISPEFVKNIGGESNMPFSVGGGINSLETIRQIILAGAERVVINTHAARNPDFILQASENFGSSTIIVCIDVKKKILGKDRTWIYSGTESTNYDPVEFAQLMEEKGAGELIIQSIDNDGMMNGYDIKLTKKIADAVKIPIIALGGAGSLSHLKEVYSSGNANGIGVGSMFVYHGVNKGVLINYPDKAKSTSLFS